LKTALFNERNIYHGQIIWKWAKLIKVLTAVRIEITVLMEKGKKFEETKL